jgi:hypothetical protein
MSICFDASSPTSGSIPTASWSGPDQRLVCSGGASSWQDLALFLVSRHAGAEEAVGQGADLLETRAGTCLIE